MRLLSSHWLRNTDLCNRMVQHDLTDAVKKAVSKLMIFENLKKQGLSDSEANQILANTNKGQQSLEQSEYQRLMAMVKE